LINFQEFLRKNLGFTSESLARIRLGPGVLGKTTNAFIALVVVSIAAIARLRTEWMILLILGIDALIFLVVIFKNHRFARENPGPALLEGAHLVIWHQQELEAAKGLPFPPATPPIVDPMGPHALPEEVGRPDQ
jgi:hypothetical protein